MIDFKISSCTSREEFKACIEKYVKYYNTQRPCFALDYDTPDNYRKRYYKGELGHRDTFSKRVITNVPKFVQKRKEEKENTAQKGEYNE